MRHRKKQPAAGHFSQNPAAGALAAVLLFTLVSCAETTLPEEGPVFIKAEKTIVTQCSEEPAPPADEFTEETETGEQAEPAGTEPVPAEEAGETDEMPQKPAGPEENDAGTEEPEDPVPADTSYTFTDVTKTVYAATDLNIRSGPSAAFAVIGSFDEGDAVYVTGVCCETGWYRVDLNGAAGCCDAAYTVDAVSSAQPESAAEGDGTGTTSAAPVSAGDGGVSESWVELCRQAYGKAPSRVREAFEDAGWQIKVRSGTWWPAYGYSMQLKGLTVYGEKTIYISARDDACNVHTVCHELGHFADYLYGTPSLTAGFQEIYNAEYRQFCSFFGYSNGYPGPEELFAEGLFEYWTSPGDLAAAVPRTYAFLRDL